MGLGSVLVDRARVVANESTGRKIEGTTQMSETHGPWFKCRLFLDMNQYPVRDDQGYRRKVVHTPQLLCGIKDLNGDPLELNADDSVEVDSAAFGRAVFRLSGDPQLIRKKRALIGNYVTVERVVERPKHLPRDNPTKADAWRAVWDDDFSAPMPYVNAVGAILNPLVPIVPAGGILNVSPATLQGDRVKIGLDWRITLKFAKQAGKGFHFAWYANRDTESNVEGAVYPNVFVSSHGDEGIDPQATAGLEMSFWNGSDFVWRSERLEPALLAYGGPMWIRVERHGRFAFTALYTADPDTEGVQPAGRLMTEDYLPPASERGIRTAFGVNAEDEDIALERYTLEVPN